MSIFNWQPDYEINDELIDGQHKKLLSLAEQLFNAVIAGCEEEQLEFFYEELREYTIKHFKDEEEHFKEIGVLDIASHQKQHAELAHQIAQVWEDEKIGFQNEKGRVLLTWVEESLLTHMMIDDQETYKSAHK